MLVKTSFYLDKRYLNIEGKANLKIALRRNGEASYISTGAFIAPEEWDGSKVLGTGRKVSVINGNQMQNLSYRNVLNVKFPKIVAENLLFTLFYYYLLGVATHIGSREHQYIMKRRTAVVLCVAGLIAVSACCEYDPPYELSISAERTECLARAKELFQLVPCATKASEDEPFTMRPGDSEVDWNTSDYYINDGAGIAGLEADISPEFFYQIVRPDSSVVRCKSELLYAKDEETGADDIFMVYYVPDLDYLPADGRDICHALDNSGDMADFSGLKIYTSMDGCLVGIAQYVDGVVSRSVYFPGLRTEEELYSGIMTFLGLMGGMRIERVIYYGDTKSKDVYYGGEIEPAICVAEYVVPGVPEVDNCGLDYYSTLYYYLGNSGLFKKTYNIINDGGGSGVNPMGIKDGDFETDREIDIDKLAKKIVDLIKKQDGVSDSMVSKLKETITSLLKDYSDVKLLTYVVDNIVNGHVLLYIDLKTTGDITSTNTRINIPHDQVDNQRGICEDMFHVYQRTDETRWKKGDLELEAKVYDCYLAHDMGEDKFDDIIGYFGQNNVEAFMALYQNPSMMTYNAALKALRSIQGGKYNETDFPVTGMGGGDGNSGGMFMEYGDCLKHINRFKKVINGIE